MFVEVLLILLSKPILLNAGGDEKHCHQHVDGEFTSKLSHSQVRSHGIGIPFSSFWRLKVQKMYFMYNLSCGDHDSCGDHVVIMMTHDSQVCKIILFSQKNQFAVHCHGCFGLFFVAVYTEENFEFQMLVGPQMIRLN